MEKSWKLFTAPCNGFYDLLMGLDHLYCNFSNRANSEKVNFGQNPTLPVQKNGCSKRSAATNIQYTHSHKIGTPIFENHQMHKGSYKQTNINKVVS